jgi:Zn-dependent M16 (insulinase) family peptidase
MSDNSINTFTKLWSKEIPEISTTATLYEHNKTKAQVLHLKNDDTNKLFGISFRTIPEDSTGIAHILEHSVLCGTKKYPVKAPFVQLMKTSLNTFLNAMTWADKTAYPVASQNEKDLENLTDVYLDSVFNPIINERILKQEGWHYELKEKKDELVYKGVVFNEMKGAYANPDRLLTFNLNKGLYPETLYAVDSGGIPEVIPELTHEDFVAFHKKYYHPSNAQVIVYGDIEIEKYLQHLEEYFKEYEYQNVREPFQRQSPFTESKKIKVSFPASKGTKGNSMSAWAFIDGLTEEDTLGMEILSYILLRSEAAPLKKALLESNLGEALVDFGFDVDEFQPCFIAGLKEVEEKDFTKVREIIESTLEKLSQGIDKGVIQGAINRIEFMKRQGGDGDYDKAVYYLMEVLKTWNYDLDPLMNLFFADKIKSIRGKAENGYFEDLIKKYFLNNNHRVDLEMVPDENLTKEQEKKEKQKLAKIKANLSDNEIEAIIEDTKALEEWQKSEDSQENLKTIPRLELSDIPKQGEILPNEVEEIEGNIILTHDLKTNGITYLNLGFDLKNLSDDDFRLINIYALSLIKLGTKNKTPEELSIELNINTGSLSISPLIEHKFGQEDLVTKFFFSLKYLEQNEEKALEILKEIISEPNFDNKKKLIQVLKSTKKDMEPGIVDSGHAYALNEAYSSVSQGGHLQSIASGVSYYEYLKSITEDIDKNIDELISRLKEVHSKVISKSNAIINITNEKEKSVETKERVLNLVSTLPGSSTKAAERSFEPKTKKTALIVPAAVNYVAQAFNLYKVGYKYNGSFNAIRKIMYSSYLWNNIRVQGGAYGGMFRFDLLSGNLGFASYRDPNLDRSLGVYRDAGKYLEELKLEKDEFEGYILGTMGDVDMYLTAEDKGWLAMHRYLVGLTNELRQKSREELLSMTIENVNDFGKALNKVSEEIKSIAVVGNKEKIEDAETKFDEVKTLF